jgi:hypothetical protein
MIYLRTYGFVECHTHSGHHGRWCGSGDGVCRFSNEHTSLHFALDTAILLANTAGS